MNVLVTGGAGFIGTHLCERLLATDGIDEVRVLDNGPSPRLSNAESLGARVREGSVCDPRAVAEVCSGVAHVVHLAAVGGPLSPQDKPLRTHEVNTYGTLLVLDAIKHSGAGFTLTSSSSGYGANPAVPAHEGLTPLPTDPYAASKLSAEAFAFAYRHSYGISSLVFRLFDIYGPGQPAEQHVGSLVASIVDRSLNGQTIQVAGDGRAGRDLTYVSLVVDYLVAGIMNRVSSAQPVNLATGRRVSILEIIGHISQLLQTSVTIEHTAAAPNTEHNRIADTTRLSSLFGPLQEISLARGLAMTLDGATGERARPELASR